MTDPWDDTPSAIDEGDAIPDPDEDLARALWRARHGGGTHLTGDWRGLWHALRAGDPKVRREADAAVLAEHVASHCMAAVAAVRAGRGGQAEVELAAALRLVT